MNNKVNTDLLCFLWRIFKCKKDAVYKNNYNNKQLEISGKNAASRTIILFRKTEW